MKKIKYHFVETVPKSNFKIIIKETKLIPVAHIYMTALMAGLI